MQGPDSQADNTVHDPHTTKGQAHMAWASYIQKFPLPTLAHRTPNKVDRGNTGKQRGRLT